MAGGRVRHIPKTLFFPPHPHIEDDESSTVPDLWLVRYQILNSSNNISLLKLLDLHNCKHQAVPTVFTCTTCSHQYA